MTTARYPRRQLLAANEEAARFYRAELLGPNGGGPRAYLDNRGFAHLLEQTPWTVGYAPASWTGLRDHLTGMGFSEPLLEASGLLTRTRRGTTIDRFRNRITFGIRNINGDLVGFTARCSPLAGPDIPKYLNPPSSALYRKDAVLFGLGEQREHLRDGYNLVIVEGPLDALAVDHVNTLEGTRLAPLATCGTALTWAHVEVLKQRLKGRLLIAFDRDGAGARAAERAYMTLGGSIGVPYAASLPAGLDPADALADGGTARLKDRLLMVQPLRDRVIEQRIEAWPNLRTNAEARVACLRNVASLVAQMPAGEIAVAATKVSHRLALPTSTVTREITEAVTRLRRSSPATPQGTPRRTPARQQRLNAPGP